MRTITFLKSIDFIFLKGKVCLGFMHKYHWVPNTNWLLFGIWANSSIRHHFSCFPFICFFSVLPSPQNSRLLDKSWKSGIHRCQNLIIVYRHDGHRQIISTTCNRLLWAHRFQILSFEVANIGLAAKWRWHLYLVTSDQACVNTEQVRFFFFLEKLKLSSRSCSYGFSSPSSICIGGFSRSVTVLWIQSLHFVHTWPQQHLGLVEK